MTLRADRPAGNAAAPETAKNAPEIVPPTAPARLSEIALTVSTADLLGDLRRKASPRGSTVVYVEHTSTRLTPNAPPAAVAPEVGLPAASIATPMPASDAIPMMASILVDKNDLETAVAPMVIAESPDFSTSGSDNSTAAGSGAGTEGTGILPVPPDIAATPSGVAARATVVRVDLVSTQEYVVGLEFGTSKVRCAIAECLKDSLRVLAYSETPAYGVSLSEVVDLQRASETAKRVMRNCAQQANMAIHSTFVGLKGLHLDNLPTTAVLALPSGRTQIEPGDVKKLKKQLDAVTLAEGRRKIEVLPQRYRVEGSLPTSNPVGLTAPGFSAHAQVITAGAQQLTNIESAVKRVGVYAEQWRMSITAAAQSCLSADERALGSLVLDFGAGSTAAAFYVDGELRAVRLFSFSGDELTDILMRKFRLSKASAEAAKVRFGGASVAALMEAGADEKIPVITADGDGRRQLNRSEMVAVLEEAVDEFIRKLCVWLEENSKAGMPGSPIDLSKQLPAGV
ncbi:MAG TPA: cell division FtsA domain-containing protein, partial [Planctomycetota bacterium]|nr:cell division FtsA domain-containing protein [Planctomycetota bacterium]